MLLVGCCVLFVVGAVVAVLRLSSSSCAVRCVLLAVWCVLLVVRCSLFVVGCVFVV